ncbi:MAG: S26 family signal peptidase [Acidimicrobiia bacterium]|nr:S26 family signal peptidase [Acidimicrobiia bacterium]
MKWPWFRIEVGDDTMWPTYLPGDRLLVRRHGRKLRAGDVVAYHHPLDDDRVILGRVVEARDQAHPTLAGDNPSRGTASREDLRIERHRIEGRVVARLSGVERPVRRTYR